MKTLKKSEVVTFVTEKVIEHFSQLDSIPSKLEIQKFISSFVDEYKVDTGKWSLKGDQPQKILKDLSDYYTKMSIAEIKACQEEIISNQATIKYPEITEKMNIVELLKELKKVCWNIKAEDIPEFVSELLEFALYARTGTTIHPDNKDFKYMRGIYLKSEMEGCGKSTVLRKIEEAASQAGLRVSDASWPLGRFGDMTQYSKNNIAILDDTDAQVLRNINETKLKAILRHGTVDNELKGLDAVPVKANAAIVAAGNVEPPKASDRCWRVFDIIPASVEGYLLQTDWGCKLAKEVENAQLTQLFNTFNVFNVFNKLAKIGTFVRSNKKSELVEKSISAEGRVYSRCKYLNSILEILKLMQNGPYDFSRISVKEIVDFSIAASKPLDAWKVMSTFKVLYGNDVISKDKVKASAEYQKYDLKGLELREPGEMQYDADESTTVKEEIEKNQLTWDLLINEFQEDPDFTPDDNGPKIDFDKEINAHVSGDNRLFNSTFEYTNERGENVIGFNKVENVNKGQEYVTVNEAIDSTKLSRKNEDMHGTNYLLEMDHIPKEEQKELIQKLPKEVKEAIHWVCDSGNKSIHTVLVTDTDTNKTREREAVLNFLNKRYFKGHLDMSAKNAGRLGRNPNAIRRNGNKQTLYYYNNNPKPLYVHNLVEQERAKEEAERLERLYKMTDQKHEHSKFPLTVETLQARKASAGRDKAIEMLNGTCDWGGMVSACMYLLATGFERDEIENAVGYDDEWLPNALDTAEKRMH